MSRNSILGSVYVFACLFVELEFTVEVPEKELIVDTCTCRIEDRGGEGGHIFNLMRAKKGHVKSDKTKQSSIV